MSSSVSRLARCGLFAALTALASQLAIPLEPVPVNLALLPVLMSGSLLGPMDGMMSQLVYLLLGAVGTPVFAGFQGGLHVLVGPTGGYLVGYVAAAGAAGLLSRRQRGRARLVFGMLAGIAACYTLGSAWFMLLTGQGVGPTLAVCVLPFLPGDALKCGAAVLLTRRLSPLLFRLNAVSGTGS